MFEEDISPAIAEALEKNERLVEQLSNYRKTFAGIGTNKAKRRLNKLAKTDSVAKAIRLAIEIEDKSIVAKKTYWRYKADIYNQKSKLIQELAGLFKEQNWIYGIQNDPTPLTTHVIYFEIPNCEQISWHFSPIKPQNFPSYKGEWDKLKNSTLTKLEKSTILLLHEHH